MNNIISHINFWKLNYYPQANSNAVNLYSELGNHWKSDEITIDHQVPTKSQQGWLKQLAH